MKVPNEAAIYRGNEKTKKSHGQKRTQSNWAAHFKVLPPIRGTSDVTRRFPPAFTNETRSNPTGHEYVPSIFRAIEERYRSARISGRHAKPQKSFSIFDEPKFLSSRFHPNYDSHFNRGTLGHGENDNSKVLERRKRKHRRLQKTKLNGKRTVKLKKRQKSEPQFSVKNYGKRRAKPKNVKRRRIKLRKRSPDHFERLRFNRMTTMKAPLKIY